MFYRVFLECRHILHLYANEDVSLGSWFIGLDVQHIDDRSLCCGTPLGKCCLAQLPERYLDFFPLVAIYCAIFQILISKPDNFPSSFSFPSSQKMKNRDENIWIGTFAKCLASWCFNVLFRWKWMQKWKTRKLMNEMTKCCCGGL